MNTLLPFAFANLPVRGRVLQLSDLSEFVPSFSSASPTCAQTLAELLAAAALLAFDAKHTLAVTMQIQHPTLGGLLFAHSSNAGKLKAYANPAAQSTSFEAFSQTPGGIFAVTMEPENLESRYQSLIPLNQPSAAGCLATYFETSVQTPTLFTVFANEERALAIMLQALPHEQMPHDDWNRLGLLLKTLKLDEALAPTLEAQTLIERLFSEDDLTLYPLEHPEFAHDDPRPRMLAALASLPKDELEELMQEPRVTLTDQTTGQSITFTAAELAHLKDETIPQ